MKTIIGYVLTAATTALVVWAQFMGAPEPVGNLAAFAAVCMATLSAVVSLVIIFTIAILDDQPAKLRELVQRPDVQRGLRLPAWRKALGTLNSGALMASAAAAGWFVTALSVLFGIIVVLWYMAWIRKKAEDLGALPARGVGVAP